MKKSLKIILLILSIILIIGCLYIFTREQVTADACPFVSALSVGSESNEVSLLQTFLYQKGYYPEGKITGYFGGLTKSAVIRFQQAKGISPIGLVGPATRGALCSMYASGSSSTECPFTGNLVKGSKSLAISVLQSFLISQVDYPPDMVTGYFGSLTEQYIKSFQIKKSLTPSGIIDYNTRNSLCSAYSSSSTLTSGTGTNSDLIVSDLSYAPTVNIQIGTNVLIGAKEKNLGTEEAPAHTYDFYLNEYRLLTENLSALKPGVERTINIRQWTCTQPGVYYFKIVLDPINKITENNKLNNSSTVTVNCGNVADNGKYSCNTTTWQCVPDATGMYTGKSSCDSICIVGDKTQPDLTLTDFNPKTFVVGKQTTVTLTEKNIGGVIASYHYLSAYLGSDTIKETQVGQTTLLYPLDPNAFKDNQFTFTCPAAGNYYLKFITDSQYNVKEGNKNNNVLTANITCTTGEGSYTGTYKFACDTVSKKCIVDINGDFTTPESCVAACSKSEGSNPTPGTNQPNLTLEVSDPGNCQGNKFVIPFTVYNYGAGNSVPTKVAILKDTLAAPPSCVADIAAIEPGKSAKVTCDYVCTDTNPHKLYFLVDYGNHNIESNEQDNMLYTNDQNPLICPAVCVTANPPGNNPPGNNPPGNNPPGNNPPTSEPSGSGYSTQDCLASREHPDVQDCVSIKPSAAPDNPYNSKIGSFWFQEYLVDNINCHTKKNTAGGCSCCSYYRAFPYKSRIIYNRAYNSEELGIPCKIDWGDGTIEDCKNSTDFHTYGTNEGDGYSGWSYKEHVYTLPAGVDSKAYCPKFGYRASAADSYKWYPLQNEFINEWENTNHCIIVYKKNWVNPPYHLNCMPWSDRDPRTAMYKCTQQVNFWAYGENPKVTTSGKTATIAWTLDVDKGSGTEAYLKDCPAVCTIDWGDGTKEAVYPCPYKGSANHTYASNGTYPIKMTLNGEFDQDGYSQCIKRDLTVIISDNGGGAGEGSCPGGSCGIARYSCNASGQCISNSSGPYTNSYCDNKCAAIQRYSCNSLGQCISNNLGMYTNSSCDNKCGIVKKYTCSNLICIENANGYYTTSNCDNKCSSTSVPRYTCSTGKCVAASNGAYTTSNCDNKCAADSGVKRYYKKFAGSTFTCIEYVNGAYCNSECTVTCSSIGK